MKTLSTILSASLILSSCLPNPNNKEPTPQASVQSTQPLPDSLKPYDTNRSGYIENGEIEAIINRIPKIKGEPQFRDFAPAVELFDLDRNHRLEGTEIGEYRAKVAENSIFFLGTDESKRFASDIYWSVEMYGWGANKETIPEIRSLPTPKAEENDRKVDLDAFFMTNQISRWDTDVDGKIDEKERKSCMDEFDRMRRTLTLGPELTLSSNIDKYNADPLPYKKKMAK